MCYVMSREKILREFGLWFANNNYGEVYNAIVNEGRFLRECVSNSEVFRTSLSKFFNQYRERIEEVYTSDTLDLFEKFSLDAFEETISVLIEFISKDIEKYKEDIFSVLNWLSGMDVRCARENQKYLRYVNDIEDDLAVMMRLYYVKGMAFS